MRKLPIDGSRRRVRPDNIVRWADRRPTVRVNLLGMRLRLEWLEERTMLSGASPGVIPLLSTLGSSSPDSSYYSPLQMRSAYSVNGISFGATAGDGTGQTIAIVNAYDDPNIASDLAVFDAQYGLAAPPSFTKVSQTGGSTSGIATNSTWEIEESLDVEWAHAMAPGANIVLVEANSNSLSDLTAAVVEAATLGSVVSMSWTTSGVGGVATEIGGEQFYDSDFLATGVTFVAGAGDNGSPGGYPAYSPNVVAVGGTDIAINSDGSYGSETAWGSSGGGTSQYEFEPSYQAGVQSTAFRTVPDVSADAGSAVWVYDSNGGGDWIGVEGTSLATPIWAGMFAIADQGRAAAGETSLSGASQTLPALYAFPSSDFHDVTTGGNGGFAAGPGYDEVTGLGTPIAGSLMPDFVAYGAATQLAVAAQPPSVVVPGSAFELSIAAENSTGVTDYSYNGPVTLSLANNPGGSALGGTLTATAVNGVATFTNVTLSQLGTGYTLQAAATGLTATTTGAFNVGATTTAVTASGTTNTFTVGGSAVAVDPGVTVSSSDTDLSGATATISAGTLKPGDVLNFTNRNGISGSYAHGVLTLTGSATPAQYTAALQSITFSTTDPNIAPRSLSIVAFDSSLESNTAAEQINVALPAPVVIASGSTANYTAGGPAAAVDPHLVVMSFDSLITGAVATISAGTLQPGDTLQLGGSNGITGNYSGGVLTLSGNATPAEYQAALRSITFSSTSTSTMPRAISIVALDTSDTGSLPSNRAPEAVSVLAPAKVTGVYVNGSAWAASFDAYLASNGLGNTTTPSLGYALPTGASQLTTLPWANINTIVVQFSEPVTVAQGSLTLLGGSGGSTPTVTGLTSLGNNEYAWSLSSPLTNNQYVISIASTTSRSAYPVTDSRGAGLDGEFTTSSSSLPSGNGLAGGIFNFFFNVLPGDVDRNSNDNATDINDVRPLASATRTTSAGYNPYYDLLGAGIINVTTLNTIRPLSGRLESVTPTAPSDSQRSGNSGLTGLELGVQETGSSTPLATGSSSSGSPVSTASKFGESSAGSVSTSNAGSAIATTTPTIDRDHVRHRFAASERFAATDEAVSDFDLADLLV